VDGTIDYVAPEQIAGASIDARTDVYAAACVAFHALTGRVPFAGGTPAKLHGHLAAPPPSARDVDPALPGAVDEVLARAMAKGPGERYASAGDLARELAPAITGRPNAEPQRTVATGRALTGIPALEAATATARVARTAGAPRGPRAPARRGHGPPRPPP
jgi:serine/threonine-protein kinase